MDRREHREFSCSLIIPSLVGRKLFARSWWTTGRFTKSPKSSGSVTAPFATGTANFFRTDGTARRPPLRDAAARSPPQERNHKTPWLDRQRKDLLKEHRPPRELRVLERENPTLFLANNFSASPRDIITNDARRNGCYRWLAHHLHGFSHSEPKARYRKFVETSGTVEIREEGRITVPLDRRSHTPILREAALADDNPRPPGSKTTNSNSLATAPFCHRSPPHGNQR